MALSVVLLGWSLKVLPLGTAYAVWTGIGAVGTAILGIFLFGESRETLRFVSIGLIVAGIVGLAGNARLTLGTASPGRER
jgi:quaternary ammonium compound-resistance protein SugE